VSEAQRDYYEVLGVPRDADQQRIKDAFRDLALRYHPDRNREPGAEERFKEIAEAYAVLSDADKRAKYDAGGFAGVADFTPQDLWGGIDLGDLFGGLGFDIGEGLFDRLFRGGRRGRGSRGADLEMAISVPLERVDTGGEETIRAPRRAPCAACKGSGAAEGTTPRTCEACHGTGEHTTAERKGTIEWTRTTTCETCRGRRSFIDHPCPSCAGRGQIEHEQGITVKIPPGIEDGTALRVPGYGQPAEVSSGSPGDLYVVVHTAPHEQLERRGADLWRVERLDVTDAVLGARREVPTLEGHATVIIPPGTQPDAVLRLRGKGLPRFGGRGRGDLYVTVSIHVPEQLSAEEERLYKGLRALAQQRETGHASPRIPRKTST
jgi:molecular chaperone DnaJ